ncbi:MAG: hypothetical protein HOL70_07920 [Candidatus Marinimicrobia bacterium]|jgi:hypothetical protein|nr:hypothetical protein [Candidatus Neomarinimicrobiota bacterium]
MSNEKIKWLPPSNTKEWAGYIFYNFVTPLLSGMISFAIVKDLEWEGWVKIVSGLALWLLWFRPLFVYLAASIWNRWFTPTPDLPINEGMIECEAYKSQVAPKWYFEGIAGEHVNYIPGYSDSVKSPMLRLKKDLRSDFKNIGKVRVHYKFLEYQVQRHYLSKVYRNGPIDYRWPVYQYTFIIDR